MRLVIVESPAKAKTINKYLGKDYKVMASYGHIRDLLSKDGSVNPEKDFAMTWEMSTRGSHCVNDIISSIKSCDELLLATDPDREGEAISWHIKQVLEEKKCLNVPLKRIAFHEITKTAIQDAIKHPRDIDSFLVDAYLARRALDYLVGFTLSPILWRKLPGSKSAGRVQSVALRIIVDREEEIEAFKKEEYWTIEAKFTAPNKKKFDAHLTHHNNKKLNKFSIQNEEQAKAIVADLNGDFSVINAESKIVKRNPSPAFITSTLQQEASRKLGFSAKKTMQLAQRLYEGIDIGGETKALITYMRTDSINLSQDAIHKIRDVVSETYGKEFIPSKPRVYNTKVKNAQEAHEAIRPVDAGIIPDSLSGKMEADLLKLYSLIWKRAVASQMSSAEFNQVQVDLGDQKGNIFRANGNTITFEGFLKVYVEGNDDQDSEEMGLLPPLKVGDATPLSKLDSLQHFTTPPPRFSEASLVKKLEELGIGRPSTYATILQVLRDRGYVKMVKKFFVPEIRGRLVTAFLLNFFRKYLEYDFTAGMEQSLDDISNGAKSKLDVLNQFWTDFKSNVDDTKEIKVSDVIDKLNETVGKFLFMTAEGESRECPECKQGTLSLKIGKFGSFIGCSRYPECNYVRRLDSVSEDQKEGDGAMLSAAEYPKLLGKDSADNVSVFLKKGPYGFYVEKSIEAAEETKSKSSKKAKPKVLRSSLPADIPPEQVTLEKALFLLSLPKVIGQFEGEDVKIGIGRFGPYVTSKGIFASIPKSKNIADVTQEDAISLLTAKIAKSASKLKKAQ